MARHRVRIDPPRAVEPFLLPLPMNLLWEELGGLVALAAGSLCIGLLVNGLQSTPLPLDYRLPKDRLVQSVGKLPLPKSTPGRWVSIELDEFQTRVAARRGTVIDARSGVFYRAGHVPGAISLPRADFERVYPEVRASLESAKGSGIMIYCSGPDCQDSELVADALTRLGYQGLVVYKEGWEEWTRAGLPQETASPH